jgi:hypothetical protein
VKLVRERRILDEPSHALGFTVTERDTINLWMLPEKFHEL